jgi:hypothetical protein
MVLKTEPKYGHFPWWPQNGNDWIHHQDVKLARRLIPSPRIFRREGTQAPYIVLTYGDIRLRLLRTLWQEVHWDGFDMGNWVEVLSRGMHNTPLTGRIHEMLWDEHDRCIQYQLQETGKLQENGLLPNKHYTAIDLRHVEPIPHLPAES